MGCQIIGMPKRKVYSSVWFIQELLSEDHGLVTSSALLFKTCVSAESIINKEIYRQAHLCHLSINHWNILV